MGPNGRRLHGEIGIGRCRNGPKRPNYFWRAGGRGARTTPTPMAAGARAGCRPVAATRDAAIRGPAGRAVWIRGNGHKRTKVGKKVARRIRQLFLLFRAFAPREEGKEAEKEGKRRFSEIARVSRPAGEPRGARPLGPSNPGGGPAHASLPCRCTRGPVIQPVSLPLRPATAVP